jgi:hypothetical protein
VTGTRNPDRGGEKAVLSPTLELAGSTATRQERSRNTQGTRTGTPTMLGNEPGDSAGVRQWNRRWTAGESREAYPENRSNREVEQ